eukprot:6201457-Pleurochrysis_carterae.AAC.1
MHAMPATRNSNKQYTLHHAISADAPASRRRPARRAPQCWRAGRAWRQLPPSRGPAQREQTSRDSAAISLVRPNIASGEDETVSCFAMLQPLGVPRPVACCEAWCNAYTCTGAPCHDCCACGGPCISPPPPAPAKSPRPSAPPFNAARDLPPGALDFRARDGFLWANDERFHVKGVNWFGSEGRAGPPLGLDKHTIDWYMQFMRDNSFNAIRRDGPLLTSDHYVVLTASIYHSPLHAHHANIGGARGVHENDVVAGSFSTTSTCLAMSPWRRLTRKRTARAHRGSRRSSLDSGAPLTRSNLDLLANSACLKLQPRTAFYRHGGRCA